MAKPNAGRFTKETARQAVERRKAAATKGVRVRPGLAAKARKHGDAIVDGLLREARESPSATARVRAWAELRAIGYGATASARELGTIEPLDAEYVAAGGTGTRTRGVVFLPAKQLLSEQRDGIVAKLRHMAGQRLQADGSWSPVPELEEVTALKAEVARLQALAAAHGAPAQSVAPAPAIAPTRSQAPSATPALGSPVVSTDRVERDVQRTSDGSTVLALFPR
jgi:hypothetical protein